MPNRDHGIATVPLSPNNAFSAIFLRRLDERDEPITSAEADMAGPWAVVPVPGRGFGLFRAGEHPSRGFAPLKGWWMCGVSGTPADTISDLRAEYDGEVLACGNAGSLLVFNGSAWHGHTANTSSGPRRSLQGAFIPRGGRAGTDFAARMQPETRDRLGSLARHVLAL